MTSRVFPAAIAIGMMLHIFAGGAAAREVTLTVASKNFAENRLLAEMFARLIEASLRSRTICP